MPFANSMLPSLRNPCCARPATPAPRHGHPRRLARGERHASRRSSRPVGESLRRCGSMAARGANWPVHGGHGFEAAPASDRPVGESLRRCGSMAARGAMWPVHGGHGSKAPPAFAHRAARVDIHGGRSGSLREGSLQPVSRAARPRRAGCRAGTRRPTSRGGPPARAAGSRAPSCRHRPRSAFRRQCSLPCQA